jgi:hypothetical protein
VALFRFSRRAEADLLSIGAYTLRTWGEYHAIRYIDDLEACCQMLAVNPTLGRAVMMFVSVCVEWRAAGMLCFTARRPEALWSLAFCASVCFPNDMTSQMTIVGRRKEQQRRASVV